MVTPEDLVRRAEAAYASKDIHQIMALFDRDIVLYWNGTKVLEGWDALRQDHLDDFLRLLPDGSPGVQDYSIKKTATGPFQLDRRSHSPRWPRLTRFAARSAGSTWPTRCLNLRSSPDGSGGAVLAADRDGGARSGPHTPDGRLPNRGACPLTQLCVDRRAAGRHGIPVKGWIPLDAYPPADGPCRWVENGAKERP